MMVFGSKFVDYEDDVVLEDFSLLNLKNSAKFLKVNSKKEAIFANANGVKFIVCDDLDLAKIIQSIANDYLFDSKVALLIDDDIELEAACDARIDAVIYKNIVG